MEKFSLKSLLIIVVVLLIGITALWQIQRRARPAAAWFNDAWQYRKAITLTNSGTGQTNVYVALTIGTSDTSRFQADAGDIRFTKQNGEPLPYYIVSGAGTASTLIHINFDTYPTGTSTFYLYYGNSSADNGFSTTAFTTAASNSSTNLLTEERSQAPIAHWSFDEGLGTTVYDMGPKQKHGIFGSGSSAPSWQSEDQCIAGRCILFNGGQTINLPNEIISNTNIRTQGVTYQAWVKLTNNNQEMLIFGQNISSGYSDSASGGIRIRSNNKASFVTYDDSAGYKYADSNTVLETNKWYLLTGTYNNTDQKMYIYVNGKLDNSTTVSNTTFSRIISNDYNKFGAIYNNGVSRQFFGFIDEPKIYAYARTIAQIKQDYRAGLSGMKSTKGVNVVASGKSAQSLNDGLVAYWKMDETTMGNGATFIDSSGNNNTGIGVSSVATTSGKFGNGVDIPGTGGGSLGSAINVIDSNSLDIGYTLPVSISFWINNDTIACGAIIKKAGLWEIYRCASYITVRFDGYDRNSSFNLDNEKWYFVTMTREPTTNTTKLYINGQQTDSWTYAVSTNPGYNGNLGIGAYYGGAWSINGKLDEIRIYNRLLSPAEVKALYEYAPGPVAYYNFEEGVGTTVYDRSGNGNNGVWQGTLNTHYGVGKIGKAGNFNGSNNNISIPNSNNFAFGTGDFTVNLWANLINGSSYKHFFALPNQGTFALKAEQSSKRIYFYSPTFSTFSTIIATYQNDKWTHISLVRENQIAYLYLNGILSGTMPSFTNNFSASNANIGNGWGSEYSDGKIDEVKIYNYARTQQQIIQDMSGRAESAFNGNTLSSKNPYLYFSFDDVIGSIGATILNTGLSQSLYPYSFLKNGFVHTADIGTSADMVKETTNVQGSYSSDYYNNWILKPLTGSAVGQSAVVTKYQFTSQTDKEFRLASQLTGIAAGDTYKVYYQTDQSVTSETNDCIKGKCVYLDGYDDYMLLNNFSPAGIAPKFTVSFWTKPIGYGTFQNQNGPIMTRLNSNYSISVNLYSGQWDNFTTKANVVSQNKWNHIAYSYDRVNLKIYVNGVGITSRPLSREISGGSQIQWGVSTGGGEYTGPGSYYHGYFDELKFYNYALSDAEIKTDYNQGAQFVMGKTNQTIGGTTTSLDYCIPGDTSHCIPPVAEYKFDEGVGTSAFDTSGNNNNAVLGTGNSAPTWTTGKIGKALDFNGNNTLTHSDISFSIDNSWTYSSWIKIPTGNSGSWQGLFGKTLGNSGGYWMFHGGGSITWYQAVGNIWYSSVNLGDEIPYDKWTHLTITNIPIDSSNTRAKIYINGTEKASYSFPWNLNTTAFTFSQIGRGDNTRYLDGQLDQIRIYNYARTPAQIAYDYNKGAPIGHWKFDECEGTIINDWSGNANHGTLTIGAGGSQTAIGTCQSSGVWYNGKDGKINSAMSFDGTDDNTIITNNSLWNFGTNDFSIGFWFKTNATKRMHPLNFGSTYSSNNISFDFNDSGYGVWVYWMGGGSPNIRTTTTYYDNKWHHIIFLRNGNNAKLYIDGNYINNTTDSSSINITGNLYIGGLGGVPFSGLIDDVRIYNYALTSEQVKQVYNGGAVNFR
jgi:hypothetical protein